MITNSQIEHQKTLALKDFKSGFQRIGKALVFTTAGEEGFGPEVVDTILNEMRGERLSCPAINHPAGKSGA